MPRIPGTSTRRSLDAIDYWIKCLKDEGVYVWLDMHYLREIKPGDGVSQGWDEIARAKGIIWGFNDINPQLIKLMEGVPASVLEPRQPIYGSSLQG